MKWVPYVWPAPLLLLFIPAPGMAAAIFALMFFCLLPILLYNRMGHASPRVRHLGLAGGVLLAFMPVFVWLLLFTSNIALYPIRHRAEPDVTTLHWAEVTFFGANWSRIVSQSPNTFLDLFLSFPYCVLHYISPLIVLGVLFFLAPKSGVRWTRALGVFAFSFGLMNSTAVLTQLFWPTAPPWYFDKYGVAPAAWTTPGDAAGLRRIDAFFGRDLFTTVFHNSPLVFGAFPSLHSGFACIYMFTMFFYSRKAGFMALGFVLWQWTATLYLRHHYMVDLFGGLFFAGASFFVVMPLLSMDYRPPFWLAPWLDPVLGTGTEATAKYTRLNDMEMGEVENAAGDFQSLGVGKMHTPDLSSSSSASAPELEEEDYDLGGDSVLGSSGKLSEYGKLSVPGDVGLSPSADYIMYAAPQAAR